MKQGGGPDSACRLRVCHLWPRISEASGATLLVRGPGAVATKDSVQSGSCADLPAQPLPDPPGRKRHDWHQRLPAWLGSQRDGPQGTSVGSLHAHRTCSQAWQVLDVSPSLPPSD